MRMQRQWIKKKKNNNNRKYKVIADEEYLIQFNMI